jgi:segregation and condensation protein B
MHILNIDNGLYEIEIVKDGEIIHRFKTMSDFIKHNTIEFVTEDNDDSGSDSDADSESGSETKNKDSNETTETTETDVKIETPVDADLTNQDVTIHETDTKTESSGSSGEGDDEGEEGDDEEGDDEEGDDEEGEEEDEEEGDDDDDSDDTEDGDDDTLILEPSKYDFVLRNFYFEVDEINKPFGFCLKYETFRKSDMKKTTYTYDEIKNMISKRRFIGIHLKTEGKDFIINLTNPVNYYLVNNTILDYSFLKMYLFNRYNFILGNTYKLSCIDNCIEMYTVEQGKKFFVKSDSFKVVDDETYKYRNESVSPIVSNEEEDATSASQETKDALTEADIEIVDSNYTTQ